MVVADEKDLGRLVKSLRELLGLSQEKLAAKLGVTFSSVNRWENGHTDTADKSAFIATIFDCRFVEAMSF